MYIMEVTGLQLIIPIPIISHFIPIYNLVLKSIAIPVTIPLIYFPIQSK